MWFELGAVQGFQEFQTTDDAVVLGIGGAFQFALQHLDGGRHVDLVEQLIDGFGPDFGFKDVAILKGEIMIIALGEDRHGLKFLKFFFDGPKILF